MKTVVVLPMGAHPFHPGHYALYQSAVNTFPEADVYIAATADTSQRPFPFQIKQKLAKLSGVPENRFVQVKSPFQAREITANLDPADTQLIFVRSEKDADKPPQAGGVKKDGNPAYLQPLTGQEELAPMAQHAYMAYLPTVEFGPGMTSATEIRTAWPKLNERRKTALVMSLYPKTQGNPPLAANVVRMLDTAIGSELIEAAAAPNVLYHKTTTGGLTGMVRSGKIDVSSAKNVDPEFDYKDYGNISFTRDPEWYHFNDMANAVEITVDANAVRKLGQLKAHAWQSQHNTGPASDEQEERINQAVPFTKQYIKKVRIIDYPEDVNPAVLAKLKALGIPTVIEDDLAEGLNEFAPGDGGGSRKFIPWPEFIEQVKQIVGKDFDVVENVIKSTIKARFVPHDPMEYGPTLLYSYYEARLGRNKGAVSTRGSIQVGKYVPNTSKLGTQNYITSFNLLKGHPFERHFDLTFDNIYEIANIIKGNTEGAYQMQPQGVAEGSAYQYHVVSKLDGNVLASYKTREEAHKNAHGNPVVSGSLETIGDHQYAREQGVAEGQIQYGELDGANTNLIIDKAVDKADGIYSFRGILFRVKNGKVTHYATKGQILQAMGRFNTAIGSYDSNIQAKSILKSIKEGVAEGSGPQVGDAVYYGKRLVGWFKGYSEHGKIITEPNYEEMGDEYANRDVYWDPQDKITIRPEQGVAEDYVDEKK